MWCIYRSSLSSDPITTDARTKLRWFWWEVRVRVVGMFWWCLWSMMLLVLPLPISLMVWLAVLYFFGCASDARNVKYCLSFRFIRTSFCPAIIHSFIQVGWAGHDCTRRLIIESDVPGCLSSNKGGTTAQSSFWKAGSVFMSEERKCWYTYINVNGDSANAASNSNSFSIGGGMFWTRSSNLTLTPRIHRFWSASRGH